MNYSILLPLLAILLYLIYRLLTYNFDYWKKRGVIFIKPTILLGNLGGMIAFKRPIGEYIAEIYANTNADVIGIWIFNRPHLIVKNLEIIKNVLIKDFQHFPTRGIANDERADPIVSRLLIAAPHDFWKAMRTHLTPLFSSGKLKAMVPLISTVGDNMVSYLHANTSVDNLEVKEVCAKFTTDVITSCAFGMNAGSFDNEDAEFRAIGRRMFTFSASNALRAVSYFFAPWLVRLFKFSFLHRDIYDFCREAFWFAVNEREASGVQRQDVVDALIRMRHKTELPGGIKFEGDVVVAQAVQFFAAGFETTSSTMSFTLYELCLNDRLQDDLRLEMHRVLGEHASLDYECINDMSLLDKIVKETLRKYPALPFLIRKCEKDYKVPNLDLVIEKGVSVQISTFGLHYDPQYYPNPQRFDPERFSEENFKRIPQCAYIPFGDGPHSCIGARMGLMVVKLGLIHILREFRVVRTKNTPVPLNFDKKSLVLQVKGGIPMQFVADRIK